MIVTYDSPEQIKMCLSCKRPQCVDCIGKTMRSNKERLRYVPKFSVVNGVRINEIARKLIRLYRTAECDRDIADKLGKPLATVTSIRRRLGLPPIRDISEEERNKLVDEWIEYGA